MWPEVEQAYWHQHHPTCVDNASCSSILEAMLSLSNKNFQPHHNITGPLSCMGPLLAKILQQSLTCTLQGGVKHAKTTAPGGHFCSRVTQVQINRKTSMSTQIWEVKIKVKRYRNEANYCFGKPKSEQLSHNKMFTLIESRGCKTTYSPCSPHAAHTLLLCGL